MHCRISDGSGIPEIGFSCTRSRPKVGNLGKVNKAFLHFLPYFWHIWGFHSAYSFLQFEKSSNMSKKEEKLCSTCPNHISLRHFQNPVSGTRSITIEDKCKFFFSYQPLYMHGTTYSLGIGMLWYLGYLCLPAGHHYKAKRKRRIIEAALLHSCFRIITDKGYVQVH